MAYILPQVLVHQAFSQVSTNTVENLNCLVFGPNYRVLRYSDASAHDSIALGEYSGEGVNKGVIDPVSEEAETKFRYPGRSDDSKIDTSSAVLYAENAEIVVGEVFGVQATKVAEKSNKKATGGERLTTVLRFENPVAKTSEDDDLLEGLKRGIAVGDVVEITDPSSTDAEYTGTVVAVYSSDENYPESGFLDTIRLDKSLPDWIAGSESEDEDVEINSIDFAVVSTLGSVTIPARRPMDNGDTEGTFNWTAGDYYFSLGITNTGSGEDGLYIEVPTINGRVEVRKASLYLQYREALLAKSRAIHAIDGASYVENELGEVSPDNPLALGVYLCCLNAGDRIVRYMATEGDSLSDYNKVLRAAEKSDDVYMLVPLTTDQTIVDAVKSHCEDMSTAENKMWRIAFVAPKTPEGRVLYTKSAATHNLGVFAKVTSGYNPDLDKEDCLCVVQFMDPVVDEDGVATGAYNPSDLTSCVSDLSVGDQIRIYDDKDPYDSDVEVASVYTISKILSSNAVRVKEEVTGAAAMTPGTPNYRADAYHPYAYAEKVGAIAAQARHLISHRMYYVFPDYAERDGVQITGPEIACACAGLASSVLPQQPITNVELTGIDGVPAVYETFSRTELNEMAEAGVFIVMQDLPGDRVYVRHQLSTDASNGNLLTSELSIIKNFDSISKYFAEAFKPYIGQYNITDELITLIEDIANGVLYDLTSSTVSGLYGPQVLPDGSEVVRVYQDEVLKDHVYMDVDLNLPKPFNNLVLTLQVI